MKTRHILWTILALFLALPHSGKAQTPEDDPFHVPTLTLSKGKYIEIHDQDSIVQIGRALLNVKTQQLVGWAEEDTTYGNDAFQADVASRWLSPDPKSDEFSSWSPYNFVEDNPIRLIDPDGRAPILSIGGEGGARPTTKTWSAVNASRIRRLAYQSGVMRDVGGSKAKFNQRVGLAFEYTFGRAFDLDKNHQKFPQNAPKGNGTIPDFVVSELVIGGEEFPYFSNWDGQFNEVLDMDFLEVKAGYKVGLNFNNGQLKKMIDYLGSQKLPGMNQTSKELGYGAHLGMILPDQTDIGWDIIEHAQNNGVNLFVVVPYENPLIDGELMFTKPLMLSHQTLPLVQMQKLFETPYEIISLQILEGQELEGKPTQIPFTKK